MTFNTGLVVLILVLLLVGPTLGFLLDHRGSQNGHKHVNHGIAAIVVLGLFVVAMIRTDMLPGFYHVFDRAGLSRTTVAERSVAEPRPHRAAMRHHPRKLAEEPVAHKRHWNSL